MAVGSDVGKRVVPAPAVRPWSRYGRRTGTSVLVLVDWVCALVAAWLMVPRVDDWPALELVPAVWVAVTCWHRLYERRHVGPGSEEYHRLLRSCLAAMAVLAAPCALLIDNDDLVRGVLLAVPATAVGSLVARRALRRMQARGIGPMAVGVGNPGERWLIDAFEGNAEPQVALERLIARRPTPGLLKLADALEDRLGLSSWRPQEGELPMSWEMLREMDAQGIVTGAHTAEHTVLTNQRLDDARREIAQCKAALEKGLKRPVKHFAYCNGYYSAGVAQALKAEGFVSAVTTEDMPNAPGVDPFALKRKVLWEGSSAGVLGLYSKPLIACQFEDTFGMLAVQKPVMGARPTNFGTAGRADAEQGISAHG